MTEMTTIDLSPTVRLPLESVTSTHAIFGVRGSGKSYTAHKLAEQLLNLGQQIAVIDPLGVFWGLRFDPSGKSASGLGIHVFGGETGRSDIPMGAGQGKLIADVVVDHQLSAILDLSQIEEEEDQARFVDDFVRRLLFRNRRAMHLILDEAQRFAPATPQRGSHAYSARSAVRRITLEGRIKGIGITIASQRPQNVDANVRGQCETLIAHRLPGNLEIGMISSWIENHGTAEQRRSVIDSLPSLDTGTAWIVSGFGGLYVKTKIAECTTYDSSRTPKPGESVISPTALPPLDIDALREQFARSIEERAQADPEILRRQILDLRAKLAEKPVETRIEVPVKVEVEVPALSDDQIARLGDIAQDMIAAGKDMAAQGCEIVAVLRNLRQSSPNAGIAIGFDESKLPLRDIAEVLPRVFEPNIETDVAPKTPTGTLSPNHAKLIDAIAGFQRLGVRSVHIYNIAAMAGRGPKSSSLSADLSTLRNAGLIVHHGSQYYHVTSLPPETKPSTLADLHRAWLRLLDNEPRKQSMLKILIAAPSHRIGYEDLARQSGQSSTSSSFDGHLKWFRDMGLIMWKGKGDISATDLLFPKGM